jgi:AhpD family alkylhydroperoxidase
MSESTRRITSLEFQKFAPGVGPALTALSKAVSESGLEEELLQLVKVRASQINGCAFCTQLHLNESRHLGIIAPKLDLLVVWHEAGIFSEREMAAFAWTELLTRLSQNHITDEDYSAVSAHFQPSELAGLSSAIVLINSWNRIAAPFQFAPPIPRHEIQPKHETANA